jgi:tetrapyrrole methylase family protein/MazG family protein
VVGLGPAGLDRLPSNHRALLTDPTRRVILRTLRHPASEELAALREVQTCDDLYQAHDRFEDVYRAIAVRVVAAAVQGPTVYAVPGSPLVGELAVPLIRRGAQGRISLEVLPGESFIDAVLATVGYDPLERGLQLLDGHHLSPPLVLDRPTLVAQLDLPVVLAEAAARLSRALPEEAMVSLVIEAGGPGERVVVSPIDQVDPSLAGPRTSMFIDTDPGGLVGVIHTMVRLRRECPWDRRQTHESLVEHLVEECYELVEAISRLQGDWASISVLEDELGDVLLQVLFHAVIAAEAGGFDIDDVSETLRRKLVRRHPHVFGDVTAATAEEVKANWDQIKEAERGEGGGSRLGGIQGGLPGLHRAFEIQRRASEVGFDWPDASGVVDKLREEVEELAGALRDRTAAAAELGDLLFSAVNLSRHLGCDPEVVLRRATARFEDRFRAMEAIGPLEGLSLAELDRRWEQAKGAE